MLRPQPTHVLAHLSDLHLRGDRSPVGGVVDADAQLEAALTVLTSWNVRCDAWVFTGDLSDDGSVASYERLRRVVGAAARDAGVEVIWAPGNHDARAEFRQVLDVPGAGLVMTEHDVRGLRVLVADTNIDGDPAGEVAPQVLTWIADRLATTTEHGTLLVLHHAPLPQVQDAPTLIWPLRNPADVADVVRGTDARAILSGHFHQSVFGTCGGVPVVVAPSLVYNQDVTRGRDLRGHDASHGFSLVEVYPDTVVHTVVPITTGRGVGQPLSRADVARRVS